MNNTMDKDNSLQSNLLIDMSTPIEPRLGKKKGKEKKGTERLKPRHNPKIQ